MTPASYNMEPVARGDQWPGITQIGPIQVDEAAPATTVVSARMQWRRSPGAAAVGHEIDTEDGIVILDEDAWTFSIPQQPLPLGAGVWHYDFETVDSVGAVRTWIFGTLEIKQDVTR
jgi:hypothetical protein